MKIEDYSFHDSQIISVTENTQDDCIDFLLNFPTDWPGNIFEQRILRFFDVEFYNVDEIPFAGMPTILNIITHGEITKIYGNGKNQFSVIRTKIEMQTNAGIRIVEYSKCELLTPKN